MNDEDKQAVVEEPDVEAQPSTEGNDAQESADNLDNLLSQYSEEVSAQSAPQQAVEPDANIQALSKEVAELRESLAQTQSEGDLKSLVDRVRGELDHIDPDIVEAWIDAKARKDPRLQKAWNDRNSNPKGLEKVAVALNGTLSQAFKNMPDAQVTEDMAAVSAAVKGASKTAPEAPEVDEKAVLSMNDAQFEEWCASQDTGQ